MADAEKEQVELDLGDSQETEVEVNEDHTESREADSNDDQFQKAETATQKRIDRLTKKMREAERREQEAIRYAQGVQNESQQLKQRMQNLDTSYVSEYTNRVTTQMQQAEAALARAIEIGDSAATVQAQRALTNLAIQADRAAQAKAQSARAQQQAQAAAQQQVRQPMPAQQPKRPDPEAEQWDFLFSPSSAAEPSSLFSLFFLSIMPSHPPHTEPFPPPLSQHEQECKQ